MKLTDFSKVSASALNAKMEDHLGWKLPLSEMSVNNAKAMLESVNSKLNSIRKSHSAHTSERNPRYTTMLMTQQVLESFIAEENKDKIRNAVASHMTPDKDDPKVARNAKNAKPDFLDIDKDGDKTEPMKKAAKDKKVNEAKAKNDPYAIGMAQAKKMAKDEPPLKKSTIKMGHKIAKKIKNESTLGEESLNELDVNTLKRYKKAAQADAYNHYNATDHDGPTMGGYSLSDEEIDAHDDAYAKRKAGVRRAEKQIAQKEPIRTALKKGASKVAKALRPAAYNLTGDIGNDFLGQIEKAGRPAYMPGAMHRITKKSLERMQNENKNFAVESKRVDLSIRKLLAEDQVTQAQSVMAAKDMVDSIQDMLEDLSKMLNEQLPPLIDNIRANIGETQASGFQQSASNSLNNLLQSAQSAREEVNNAVLSLTGEGPAPMEMPDEMPPNDMTDIDTNDDDEFSASDAAVGGELPMGREKR